MWQYFALEVHAKICYKDVGIVKG